MAIRHFPVALLKEWDLPYAFSKDAPVILHREQVDSGRWTSTNELVFRAPDDGKTYRIYYEEGLTELQEDTDPWGHDDLVRGVEVEQVPVTVMVWKPVKEV